MRKFNKQYTLYRISQRAGFTASSSPALLMEFRHWNFGGALGKNLMREKRENSCGLSAGLDYSLVDNLTAPHLFALIYMGLQKLNFVDMMLMYKPIPKQTRQPDKHGKENKAVFNYPRRGAFAADFAEAVEQGAPRVADICGIYAAMNFSLNFYGASVFGTTYC